jgi:hypothetical protein
MEPFYLESSGLTRGEARTLAYKFKRTFNRRWVRITKAKGGYEVWVADSIKM